MAVVGGEADLTVGEEVIEAAAVLSIAEAEQDLSRHPASGEAAAQQRQRRDPDATADEDRARRLRGELARLGEGVAERPVDPDPLPRLDRAEPLCAGADLLEQEVEPDRALCGHRVGDRERPGQEGAPSALLPVALRGQHVELPRGRLRPALVAQREDPVTTGGPVVGDLAEPSPRRRRHRGWEALVPWISWRLRTSASPATLAAIARAAAVAPVIVVTQGTSWRTAAVRIS